MQKKSKTILTAVVTALFVLSFGYFALLAPTTAWYYLQEDKAISFEFGDFASEIARKAGEVEADSIVLPDATRFADGGETKFDDMTHVLKVTVTNRGTMSSASVTLKVMYDDNVELLVDGTKKTTAANGDVSTAASPYPGLKWFIYDPSTTSPVSAKTAINAMLTAKNADWPLDYKDLKYTLVGENNTTQWFTNYNPVNGQAEAAYEAYNTEAIKVLKEHNDRGISVPAPASGSNSKDLYIVFWAEYGALKNAFGVGTAAESRTVTEAQYGETSSTVSAGDPLIYKNLKIKIMVGPDTGGTQTQNLTITNSSSAQSSVQLKLWDVENAVWDVYEGAYMSGGSSATTGTNGDITGIITIGANGSATIESVPVGKRYMVTLLDDDPTAAFAAGSAAAEVSEDGTVVSGTISNNASTNAITLQAAAPKLTIKNTSTTAAVSVNLYTWSSGAWAQSGSTLSVAAEGSVNVTTLSAGTRYKLVIQGNPPTSHFNGTGNASQIIGTIENGTTVVTIIPNS